MTDPISLSSGLLTLVSFALQSSRTLYQEIRAFQNQAKSMRELKEELEALNSVLQALQDVVRTESVDLAILELPLHQCGKACEDFQRLVAKFTKSSNDKTSWRDWAKLKYMGDDLTGFKDMLVGYKSTISIALACVNIRTMTVTSQVVNDYSQLIERTTSDLQEHLQKIDGNLELLATQRKLNSEESVDQLRMREEIASTQQCLKICEEVSSHINMRRTTSIRVDHDPVVLERRLSHQLDGLSASQFTTNELGHCKSALDTTISMLGKHLDEIQGRVNAPNAPLKTEAFFEHGRIMGEINSIKQCLKICSTAAEETAQSRINVFEDVSMADDGHQVIVATLGDLISAKRIVVGARSTQWLGQMSDASLQQLSQSHARGMTESAAKPEIRSGVHFENRYGVGMTLDRGTK